MNAATDACVALGKALAAFQGLNINQPGDPIDPPAAVLSPPALEWEAFGRPPTTARLLVFVMVPKGDDAQDRLLNLVPRVAEAIEEAPGVDAVVSRADPAAYTAGRDELPAYALTVEVSL